MPEPSSSSNAADDGTPPVSELQVVAEPAVDEPYSDTPERAGLISEAPRKSAPWSVVVLLVCLVIGLLIAVVNKSNETPRITPSVSSSEINERELALAQSQAETMRTRVAQMKQRIGELEQQQEAERKVAEACLEKLLREKKVLEDSSSNSIAEIDRLKRQLQSAAPKDPPRPAPPQAEPAVSNNNGTLYKVTGLIDGDTLNVRSGPGAINPIVIRLYNGVELSVLGGAVTNGPDTWLPCLIDKTFTDPSSGLVKTLKQKGWVNSYFIEQVPGQ